MSIAIRKSIPTPLEVQYEELKKLALIEKNTDPSRNPNKEHQSGNVNDQITLSSTQVGKEQPAGRKPSQAVTTEEMQALRTAFSVYA